MPIPPPKPWSLKVSRCSQVDATRLEHELTSMLREELTKVFSFFDQVDMGRDLKALNNNIFSKG